VEHGKPRGSGPFFHCRVSTVSIAVLKQIVKIYQSVNGLEL
jgi:hypothetical protein